MPSSRETSAIVRPESITRWAASILYSVVKDLRVRDMRTSSQRNPRSRYLGVHHPGVNLTTQEQLRIAIVTWIEKTYHRKRRQRRLGKLTPIEFETINQATSAA